MGTGDATQEETQVFIEDALGDADIIVSLANFIDASQRFPLANP